MYEFVKYAENRPNEIEKREEFGHWEFDTVVCKRESSSVLLTLDERKIRKRHIIKIDSRSSQSVEQAFTGRFSLGTKLFAEATSNVDNLISF